MAGVISEMNPFEATVDRSALSYKDVGIQRCQIDASLTRTWDEARGSARVAFRIHAHFTMYLPVSLNDVVPSLTAVHPHYLISIETKI
jgi:hypothetical protein